MSAMDISELVLFGVGAPAAAVTIIGVMVIIRGWWIRAREFKIQEKRIQMEERLRSDELGTRILRSEDPIRPSQLDALTEELRQLRQEVAELKQDLSNRVVG